MKLQLIRIDEDGGWNDVLSVPNRKPVQVAIDSKAQLSAFIANFHQIVFKPFNHNTFPQNDIIAASGQSVNVFFQTWMTFTVSNVGFQVMVGV